MSSELKEIEPGLHARYPVMRLTHSDRRCVHGYQTISPISADGGSLVYFEFRGSRADRSLESLEGRVVVADADGSSPRTLVEMRGSSPSSGPMQQWVGKSHRVAASSREDDMGQRWHVFDVETGTEWKGEGNVCHASPDGIHLFLATGEDIHLLAHKVGKSLAPEEVVARVVDYETGSTDVQFSIADVLECLPEPDRFRDLHLIIKQTWFSPDGDHLLFAVNNRWSRRLWTDEAFFKDLFVVDRDGSNMRWLGPYGGHPIWHPSGEYVFAVGADPARPGRYTLYPIDGSTPEVLSPDWVGHGHPSIQTREGRYLVTDVYDSENGRVALRLYDLEEMSYDDVLVAEYEDFSNDSGTHLHPAWTPDGKSIILNSAHTGVAQLYRVDLA